MSISKSTVWNHHSHYFETISRINFTPIWMCDQIFRQFNENISHCNKVPGLHIRGGLISLCLYKENNRLRDWKNVFTYSPLRSTHLLLRCSNFFNPSKNNSFGCAKNRKSQRLTSTPTYTGSFLLPACSLTKFPSLIKIHAPFYAKFKHTSSIRQFLHHCHYCFNRNGFPFFFFKHTSLILKKSKLMRSSCCLCDRMYIPPNNCWTPKAIFMKVGTYIVASEPISTASFINSFHQ
jgi:hypothetical protein